MKLSPADIALFIATELVKKLYRSIYPFLGFLNGLFPPFLGFPDGLFPKNHFEELIHIQIYPKVYYLEWIGVNEAKT